MWKDDYRIGKIKTIVFSVLLVALLAGLTVAIIKTYKLTEAEDEALASVQTQQREEQSAAKKEEISVIESEYQKDLQTLQDYLPGIVCWGDSLTAGSPGNISYPYILQKYIDTYICDVYNFRLSIDNAEDYSRLKWGDYTVSIPVVNMGAGQEDTNTILGRSGVVPYVTAEEFVIPAGTDEVEIKIRSSNGNAVTPLTGGSAGVNNVTINGIEGTLSIDPSSYKRNQTAQYYFKRIESGKETVIPADSVITTAAADQYKDYIHIICMGTYGGFDKQADINAIDNLVEQTKQMVSRQTGNSDRYLVLGMCSYMGRWDGGNMNLDVIDAAMMQEFGSHYINIRKYLCEDGITDYALTSLPQDQKDAADSIVPEVFRSMTGMSELNGKAYELIGKLVYDRMDRLGYFDEIREELYIEEASRELLKEYPQYFDRLLRSGTALLK